MDWIQLKDKQFEVLISEESLLKKIGQIAEQLNKDLKDKDPVFICVLNGAFMFATELFGRFQSTGEIAFIRLKSYDKMNRNSKIKEMYGLEKDIEGRHIVVVEDIIDTGHTMEYLLSVLKEKNPTSIRIATLLFKPTALQLDIKPDYVVAEIPNDFVVGFGLDYDEHGRNLRNIYKVVDKY